MQLDEIISQSDFTQDEMEFVISQYILVKKRVTVDIIFPGGIMPLQLQDALFRKAFEVAINYFQHELYKLQHETE